MPPEVACGLVAALVERGVDACVGGGWAIDALVGGSTGLADLDARLAAAAALPPLPAWQPPEAVREDAPANFLAGVARVHEYLRAGDTFQVNLSRKWRAEFARAPEPAALYARLRAANPAPFAGLLAHAGWALASSSPERLVSVRGAVVETRPIAGTRARLPGDDDAARVDELVADGPAHGWTLLFPDRHPYAGGPEHYAAYLASTDNFEVELVAIEPEI